MDDDVTLLREFSSTSHYFDDIPLRVRRGFSIVEVQFTCVDAVEHYLAVGTNVGLVYWCDRKKRKIERLRPEKYGAAISFVKVISSVDFMLAAGDVEGVVSIFVIPKEKPLLLPSDHLRTTRETIERFTVAGIHKSSITAAEWSVNGQKLFTGDDKGIVSFIEMEFRLNIVKSREILNEKFPIVQLSYSQPQLLLVATEYRCIIYNQSNDSEILQVGHKERANLCKLGAVMSVCSSLPGPVIYCARPKQRIWLADTKGQVCKTYLFNDALTLNYPKIRISSFDHNPTEAEKQTMQDSSQTDSNVPCDMIFSCLRVYKNKFLLVHDSKSLVLLNPEKTTIDAGLSLMKILSVAINKDEIFILEGLRRIRRIAFYEDPFQSCEHNFKNAPEKPIDLILNVVNRIKEEASGSAIKPFVENIVFGESKRGETEVSPEVSPAEEALELRGQLTANSNAKKADVGIVFSRRKKYSTEQHDAETKKTDEKIVDARAIAEEETAEVQREFPSLKFEEIPADIAPDLRTPDSIMRDVRYKEEQLAFLLNVPIEDAGTSSVVVDEPSPVANNAERDPVECNFPTKSDENSIIVGHATQMLEDSSLYDSMYSSIEDVDENTELQSTKAELFTNETGEQTEGEHEVETEESVQECDDLEIANLCYDRYWKKYSVPFAPKWICVTNTGIFCGTSKSTVYYAKLEPKKLTWIKQKYRTGKMSISFSEAICWRLQLGILYAWIHDSKQWSVVARNVDSIAVKDDCAWYVRHGEVYVQTRLSFENPFSETGVKIDCPVPVTKVACFGSTLWVLTTEGEILSRQDTYDNDGLGSSWKRVWHPEHVIVSDIVLGCRNSGWIVDENQDIYFTNNFDDVTINWWQTFVGQLARKADASLSNKLSKLVPWSKESSPVSLICCGENAVWATKPDDNSIYSNKTAVLGHRWIKLAAGALHFKTRWKAIVATYIVSDLNSCLWCLNANNDLFLYQSLTTNFRAIEAPTTKDIICITAFASTLWLLTENGKVFSRVGFSESNPFGCDWEELQLTKYKPSMLQFKRLCCGADVVWGINTKDEVYALATVPSSITNESGALDWKLIDDFTSNDTKLIDIIVGPNKCSVWAIDNKFNVYVRQAIFDDFSFGTEWINVSGIQAVQLAISLTGVWALTIEGEVFKRFGVSHINYIGDYWVRIPDLLSLITVSDNESLWGVSKTTGRLQQYESHVLGLSDEFIKTRKVSETIEDEWTIV